jgi:hypothetical protein
MKMESIPISNIQNVLYIFITIFPEVVRMARIQKC